MSMNTIYVLMKDGEVVDIAPSLAADQALEFFKNGYTWNGLRGQVYACKMSDTAALEVRDAFFSPPSKGKVSAGTLVKRYSQQLNHCADV